jgi:hypothetical protein
VLYHKALTDLQRFPQPLRAALYAEFWRVRAGNDQVSLAQDCIERLMGDPIIGHRLTIRWSRAEGNRAVYLPILPLIVALSESRVTQAQSAC